MAHDVVDLGKSLTSFKQAFFLSPVQWGQCGIDLNLEWTTIKFTQENRATVPRESGLYAFTVSPSVTDVFAHHYLMYLGQAGAGTTNTLHARYQDYITPSKVLKRPRIQRLMSLWPDHIWYSYAALDSTAHDLKAIERALNDALLPPCVAGDFSTVIRRAVGAFR